MARGTSLSFGIDQPLCNCCSHDPSPLETFKKKQSTCVTLPHVFPGDFGVTLFLVFRRCARCVKFTCLNSSMNLCVALFLCQRAGTDLRRIVGISVQPGSSAQGASVGCYVEKFCIMIVDFPRLVHALGSTNPWKGLHNNYLIHPCYHFAGLLSGFFFWCS